MAYSPLIIMWEGSRWGGGGGMAQADNNDTCEL